MKFQIPRYIGFKVGVFRISPITNDQAGFGSHIFFTHLILLTIFHCFSFWVQMISKMFSDDSITLIIDNLIKYV